MTRLSEPCKHGDEAVCQRCDPMPWRVLCNLNRLRNKSHRWRRGLAPLRKRRGRLHKKLAKRGFSATPTASVWYSPQPGYGVRGTKYDPHPSIPD